MTVPADHLAPVVPLHSKNFRTAWIVQVEDTRLATRAPHSYISILKALGAHATESKGWANARPPVPTLAKKTGMCEKTIKTALKWGRTHGLIKRLAVGCRTKGRASVYQLILKNPDQHHGYLAKVAHIGEAKQAIRIEAGNRAWATRQAKAAQQQAADAHLINHLGAQNVGADPDSIGVIQDPPAKTPTDPSEGLPLPLLNEAIGVIHDPPITTKGGAAAPSPAQSQPVDSVPAQPEQPADPAVAQAYLQQIRATLNKKAG